MPVPGEQDCGNASRARSRNGCPAVEVGYKKLTRRHASRLPATREHAAMRGIATEQRHCETPQPPHPQGIFGSQPRALGGSDDQVLPALRR